MRALARVPPAVVCFLVYLARTAAAEPAAVAPAPPVVTAAPAATQPGDGAAVARVLDAFHAAAARADEEAYFALLADNAVFLGTDAAERWDRAAFRAFAHPYFAQGKGWTFVPRDRHLDFARGGRVAWFDELLDSASYGECRGTGVVELTGTGWQIAQYHLTIPIPNDLAKEVVARIRAAAKPAPAQPPTATAGRPPR